MTRTDLALKLAKLKLEGQSFFYINYNYSIAVSLQFLIKYYETGKTAKM